jgi:hypothetical protein
MTLDTYFPARSPAFLNLSPVARVPLCTCETRVCAVTYGSPTNTTGPALNVRCARPAAAHAFAVIRRFAAGRPRSAAGQTVDGRLPQSPNEEPNPASPPRNWVGDDWHALGGDRR